MVIMIFSGSLKGGRKHCANSNCPRQSDNATICGGCKNSPQTRGKPKWKKAKRFTRQNSIAITAVFMNILNALKLKRGHPSARLASETASTSVRNNLPLYPYSKGAYQKPPFSYFLN